MKGEWILDKTTIQENLVSDLLTRELILQYSRDGDGSDNISQIVDKEYNDVWRVRYGRSRIRFDTDLTNKVDTIELPFTSTPIISNNLLDNSSLDYPTSAIDSYTPKVGPKILFINRVPCDFPFGYDLDPIGGQSRQFLNTGFYHTATQWNDPYNPTEDLSFGIPRETYFIPDSEFTENNLVNKFWLSTIREIDSAKLISVELYLSDMAVSELEINTKLYLEILDQSGYFIINKLTEWDAITKRARLELITYDGEIEWDKIKNINISGRNPLGGRTTDIRQDTNFNSSETTSISGKGNTSEGDFNRVRGDRNELSGNFNDITGIDNYASGSYNTLSGTRNGVSGDYNTIEGSDNKTTGDKNKITGDRNWVEGENITVSGSDIKATESGAIYYENYKINSFGELIKPVRYVVDTSLLTIPNNYIEFIIDPDNPFDIFVSWGDGLIQEISGGAAQFTLGRTYDTAGVYVIEIWGELSGTWYSDLSTTNEAITDINRFGEIQGSVSLERRFTGLENLTEVRASDGFYFEGFNSTFRMFAECDNLSLIDVTSWYLNDVEDFNEMFKDLNSGNEVVFIGIENLNFQSGLDYADFLEGTLIRPEDYEQLWIQLGLTNLNTNVDFSGGPNKLQNGSPGWLAREDKVNNSGWSVLDGGDI